MRRGLVTRGVLAAVAVGLFGTGPVSSPAVASTGTTQCTSDLPPGTYHDIVVPPGARCRLDFALVTGSIRVLAGAQLFSFDSVIHGSIVGEGAASTRSTRNSIGGHFVVMGGGPAPAGPTAALCGTEVAGNVVIRGTVGGIGVRFAPIPGFDSPTSPACGGNRVAGHLVIQDNEMTRPLLVLNNTVHGNAYVANNRGPGPKTVSGNTVGASLVCTGNEPPFEGGGNSAGLAVGQCGS